MLHVRGRALAAVMLFAAACGGARVPPAAIEDARIAARVKTAIVNDAAVGVYAIEVRVRNGVTRLSGTLPSQDLIARALTLAERVPGVTTVESDLRVGAPASAVMTSAADESRRSPGAESIDDEELDPRSARQLLAVGASVNILQPDRRTLADGVSLGPMVRVGAGRGLGVAIGFGWFGAELRDSAAQIPIGRVRIRPVMAGVRYTFRTLATSTSFSLVAGPAINAVSAADRADAGELPIGIGNSLAWRPGVSFWVDLSSRTALNISAGYVITRPRLTLVGPDGVFERPLRADALVLRAGLAYKVF